MKKNLPYSAQFQRNLPRTQRQAKEEKRSNTDLPLHPHNFGPQLPHVHLSGLVENRDQLRLGHALRPPPPPHALQKIVLGLIGERAAPGELQSHQTFKNMTNRETP